MPRLLLPGFLLLLLPALLLGAGDGAPSAGDRLTESIRENTTELEALRNSIKSQRERMEAIDTRAADVRRTYHEIEQEIEAVSRVLSEMDRRERQLLAQGDTLRTTIAASREEFAGRRRVLGRSLRAMYMRGQGGNEFQTLLTAESLSELLAGVKLARLVARLEAGLVEQTRSQGRELVLQQRLLDSALAEIWQSREEAGGQSSRLEMLAAEKSAALRELDTERQDVKNRLLELDMNEQKLTYVLEDLEQQRIERAALPDTGAVPGVSLATLAGGLEWPVQGDLLRGFGRSVHPRFKTVTLNNGVNIGAPVGAPVAAVAGGSVEFADDLPGFGRCVILDHGEGYYTLYAHLDRVFVVSGAEIARGQVVAEVGRPGPGEEPQLYFEVRHGRTPLDPADWLRSR